LLTPESAFKGRSCPAKSFPAFHHIPDGAEQALLPLSHQWEIKEEANSILAELKFKSVKYKHSI